MPLRRSRAIAGFFFVLVCQAGCPSPDRRASPAASPRSIIHIAAASDLTFALPELIRVYTRDHPQVELRVTFGASGNLCAQLSQEAPFDLFLSADSDYPRRLVEQGLAADADLFVYARGRLAVWVPVDSPLPIERLGLRAALDPAVDKVALANPRVAPYGRAALAALHHGGLADDLAEKLLWGENVAQVVHLVRSGGAQLGIVSLSIAAAPASRGQGRYVEIPATAYPPLQQAGLVLPWGKHPDECRAFRDFLVGPAGQKILQEFGLQSEFAAPSAE